MICHDKAFGRQGRNSKALSLQRSLEEIGQNALMIQWLKNVPFQMDFAKVVTLKDCEMKTKSFLSMIFIVLVLINTIYCASDSDDRDRRTTVAIVPGVVAAQSTFNTIGIAMMTTGIIAAAVIAAVVIFTPSSNVHSHFHAHAHVIHSSIPWTPLTPAKPKP